MKQHYTLLTFISGGRSTFEDVRTLRIGGNHNFFFLGFQ